MAFLLPVFTSLSLSLSLSLSFARARSLRMFIARLHFHMCNECPCWRAGSRLEQLAGELLERNSPTASPSFIRKKFNQHNLRADFGREKWAVAREKVRELSIAKAVIAAFPEEIVFGIEGGAKTAVVSTP